VNGQIVHHYLIRRKSATIPLRDFRVVCIGGSAGATKTYSEILRKLPCDTGLAFIILPHRGNQNPSSLVKLLALATQMPVVAITNSQRLTPNCIFVTPPGFHLRIDGVHLFLDSCVSWGWPTTLNCFLESLANSLGPPSAAVILSGLGNDGSSALGGFKDAGGLTLAQSDPRWTGMPDCAIATGNIDLVLDSDGIADRLAAFAKGVQEPC
jgi:two-component system, chemotaxis family, CheB/CheR fusion protein